MTGIDIEAAYAAHGGELVQFATGLVGPSDAADVVSTLMIRIMDAPRSTPVEHPRAYLFRAVVNEARMHHRSTMRRRLRELRADRQTVAATPPEVSEAVLAAVERLSIRQRAVVVLTYWHDLDDDQTAELLGISSGSVRRHLARAHVHLRRSMQRA